MTIEGDIPGEPLAFQTGYQRQSGEGLVFGGVGVALIGVLAALTRAEPAFLVITAAGLIASGYFYPLVERHRPVLAGDDRGLYIDGLGVIDWSAISGIDRTDRAVRSILTTTLSIRLNRPSQEAVIYPAAGAWWRQLTTRIWKVRGDRIDLQVHTLTMKPDQLMEKVTGFLPRPGLADS